MVAGDRGIAFTPIVFALMDAAQSADVTEAGDARERAAPTSGGRGPVQRKLGPA
jgi:hypothetical protein